MGYSLIDMMGKKCGLLSPIRYVGTRGCLWLCRCDCGNTTLISGGALRDGRHKSCGCYKRIEVSARMKTHGMCKTREYITWSAMRQRCRDPNTRDYKYYGGRGVKVCKRWNASFENFLHDMGKRPPGKTIDRIDTDGDYKPSNCRWATVEQQLANRKKRKH